MSAYEIESDHMLIETFEIETFEIRNVHFYITKKVIINFKHDVSKHDVDIRNRLFIRC